MLRENIPTFAPEEAFINILDIFSCLGFFVSVCYCYMTEYTLVSFKRKSPISSVYELLICGTVGSFTLLHCREWPYNKYGTQGTIDFEINGLHFLYLT